MEIRCATDSRMEDSDSNNKSSSSPDKELHSRPASPCESEISVGCENETGDQVPSSPMDMTEAMAEDDDDIAVNPSSPVSCSSRTPSRSRSRVSVAVPSPQSTSPTSVHEGSEESYSYMSEEEYFRPLKRLAMSEGSPRPPSSRDNISEPMSSPEPSHHHPMPIERPSSRPSVPQDARLRSNDERVTAEEVNPNNDRLGNDNNNGAVAVDQHNKLSDGLRSFSILDILSYKPSRRKSSIPVKIVRPWDTREESSSESTTPTRSHKASNNNNNNANSKNNNSTPNTKRHNSSTNDRGSALDALFKMTNTTLDNLNKEDKADAVNLFNNRQPSKKKRKSRTAFTNHQIFELEKRFLYQKYLSPADRDELAQNLGLSNAQVITWFQNRRAKLKRDMEELKRDVETSKVIHNKSLLEASANVVAFLKAKELPKIHLGPLPH